jgi:uncharacterized membrane protein YkvA (DUF1232 family)
MMEKLPFSNEPNEEQEKYVQEGFWEKIKKFGSKVPFVTEAIAMYYCAIDPNTSIVAKGIALGALVYFISPVDAIPDIIAILGFTDDAGVIAAAITALGKSITEEHMRKAREFLLGDEGVTN